ncbi:MAG: hypothetical protein Fur0041_03850 [Bacteroidia bacterium]
MKKIFAILITSALFLGSCEMQKRHYMDGFYIKRNHSVEKTHQTNRAQNDVIVDAEKVAAQINENQNTVADAPVAVSPVAVAVKANNEFTAAGNKKTTVLTGMETETKVQPVISKKSENKKSATQNTAPGGDVDPVVLIILAIFIPPLAVYLYEGSWTKRCTVNLILTLLCGLPGMIHALIVVLE